MSILNKSFEEQLNLATTSTDASILIELKKSRLTPVRVELAKNIHTPSEILKSLLFDPALNVSYKASKNQNCNSYREFKDLSDPCIQCEKTLTYTSCQDCASLA